MFVLQIMAIKKVDNAALSLQEEDNFLEAVSNMSRLRHPNIVALAGYCAEHGQRLLVHDYIGSGSLHDMLHFADERSKMLTWNARVRVALGTARALEYVNPEQVLKTDSYTRTHYHLGLILEIDSCCLGTCMKCACLPLSIET